jgi:hypothetical protein
MLAAKTKQRSNFCSNCTTRKENPGPECVLFTNCERNLGSPTSGVHLINPKETGAIHLAIRNAAANISHFATCNIVSCSKPALNSTLTFKKISPTASESRKMILANGDLFSFHWLSSDDFLELIDINSVKPTPASLGITNTEDFAP